MALIDIQMNSKDFVQKEQLDAGGFGMVSLGYHKRHGLVVLKTVYTGPQHTQCNTSLLEEGEIMYKLNHNRVVKLLGVILEDGNYSLVMEYVRKGNLMSVLKATPIPLSVKGRFILEIIEGMLYLTEQGLVHKDLKPENILVDEDFHIKIADLGVACFKNWSKLTKEETRRQKKIKYNSKSNAGTLSYMAPEHLKCINTIAVEKSDVYSFGIVLWAIFANKEPYENALNDTQVQCCVLLGNRPLRSEIEGSCPEEIMALMEHCWKQEAEDRPTFAEIHLMYKPFYQKHFEECVEADVKKIKEVYPEPNELVKRMESLQVDAVADPASGTPIDVPGSLHSSANTMNEDLFAACPENGPVESCETSFEPPMTLERKLRDELNYHIYGSRMDKPESRPVSYSAEMQEEERRRKVSYDPFAKAPAARRVSESYQRAANARSNISHDSSSMAHHSPLQQQTPLEATPETDLERKLQLDPSILYGPGPTHFRTSASVELVYGSNSANSFSKPPVPESGVDHQFKPPRPYHYLKSPSTESDPMDSTPFQKANFAQPSSALQRSTEETAQYNIFNSSGIQIGSFNRMEIKDQTIPIRSTPANPHYNNADYEELFKSTTVVSDVHLNCVRDKLAKQWKHCARKLGFSDPDLDEIDHDYERDGLKEKVYQMFQRWLMKEGSKGATVGKLALALYACQRIDLLNCFVRINQDSEMGSK
ncbi:receptor-interacting serine/threonine-protein kinase 1 [Tiliqua scincoides]|uniref:receptor-interacting serine/threonine-protein kinase 1 n=1 Tax=Tiliqua scincoides TaxID=71010 RepID=UPI0034637BE4